MGLWTGKMEGIDIWGGPNTGKWLLHKTILPRLSLEFLAIFLCHCAWSGESDTAIFDSASAGNCKKHIHKITYTLFTWTIVWSIFGLGVLCWSICWSPGTMARRRWSAVVLLLLGPAFVRPLVRLKATGGQNLKSLKPRWPVAHNKTTLNVSSALANYHAKLESPAITSWNHQQLNYMLHTHIYIYIYTFRLITSNFITSNTSWITIFKPFIHIWSNEIGTSSPQFR